MNDMILGQILTRAQVIMSDKKEPVAVAIQSVQSITNQTSLAQSAGAVDYTDCISAER